MKAKFLKRDVLDLTRFPEYFGCYHWEAKHALFGYPADKAPEFRWIRNLECRGLWLREALRAGKDISGLYLLKDIIQWGGSQNGCLQKFEDGVGRICLAGELAKVVKALPHPKEAISAAMEISGLGLTYGSKLLRFLDPVNYGALDARLRSAMNAAKQREHRLEQMPTISDNRGSAIRGYEWFCGFARQLQNDLEDRGIKRPNCTLAHNATRTRWRAADVEMALFRWATHLR